MQKHVTIVSAKKIQYGPSKGENRKDFPFRIFFAKKKKIKEQ